MEGPVWKDRGGGTEGAHHVEGPTWRDLGQHTGGPYVEGFKWRGQVEGPTLSGGTYGVIKVEGPGWRNVREGN